MKTKDREGKTKRREPSEREGWDPPGVQGEEPANRTWLPSRVPFQGVRSPPVTPGLRLTCTSVESEARQLPPLSCLDLCIPSDLARWGLRLCQALEQMAGQPVDGQDLPGRIHNGTYPALWRLCFQSLRL